MEMFEQIDKVVGLGRGQRYAEHRSGKRVSPEWRKGLHFFGVEQNLG